MSTLNICFRGEIRKISAFSDEKRTLSVAMNLFVFFLRLVRILFRACGMSRVSKFIFFLCNVSFDII